MDVLKRNNVKITGKGAQTIIFAHGFGCDQQVWKEVIEEFKADYRVVYGRIAEVMAAVSRSGITRLSFVTASERVNAAP